MTTKKEQLVNAIENEKARSCWNQGVKIQALEMVEELDDETIDKIANSNMREVMNVLRNGADSWEAHSWGGCALICALIYDPEICERYATPSEIKRTRCGEKKPNAHEEWLDVQARGCAQAADLIYWTLRNIVFI